jgi:hypothetical protein
MKRIITLVLILSGVSSMAQTVTDFASTDVTSDKRFTLRGAASSHGIVIVFISNTCPFDEYYYGRLNKIASDYSGRIPVVFINSYSGDGESVAEMKSKAVAKRFTAPYLEDKDQAIMQALKATRSPEAIVLKAGGDGFTVFYRGAVDDNAQVATDVHNHYLAEAIEALLNGQRAPRPVVRPMGCVIRAN